jgi:hypothetical protein
MVRLKKIHQFHPFLHFNHNYHYSYKNPIHESNQDKAQITDQENQPELIQFFLIKRLK